MWPVQLHSQQQPVVQEVVAMVRLQGECLVPVLAAGHHLQLMLQHLKASRQICEQL
jgi:hypothetical protein